jgi:hypothetical protein
MPLAKPCIGCKKTKKAGGCLCSAYLDWILDETPHTPTLPKRQPLEFNPRSGLVKKEQTDGRDTK